MFTTLEVKALSSLGLPSPGNLVVRSEKVKIKVELLRFFCFNFGLLPSCQVVSMLW